jgi:hypothetical protein
MGWRLASKNLVIAQSHIFDGSIGGFRGAAEKRL